MRKKKNYLYDFSLSLNHRLAQIRQRDSPCGCACGLAGLDRIGSELLVGGTTILSLFTSIMIDDDAGEVMQEYIHQKTL